MKTSAKRDPTKEYPDTTPIEIPAELRRPETVDEKIKRLVLTNIQNQALKAGLESFEESDDFDVEDSFDGDGIMSPYDVHEMEPEFPVGSPDPQEEPVAQEPEKAPQATEPKPIVEPEASQEGEKE